MKEYLDGLSEDGIYLVAGLCISVIWVFIRTVIFVMNSFGSKPTGEDVWEYVFEVFGGGLFSMTFGPAILVVGSCVAIVFGIPYFFVRGVIALIYRKR